VRLTRYILRLHVGPFLFGTSAVVFLFFLQFIFKFLNDLVGKGISYWVIAKFIAYNLAWMLVLAVPMGVLVSTLMAYGKLAGNNELTIVKASGGSALRAMYPGIVGGLCLVLGLYLFNDKVLPETNHQAYVLQTDIRQVKPTFAMEEGRFTTLQNYSILARQIDHDKNVLRNVTIYGQDGEMLNVITAREATLRFTTDLGRMLMTFRDGELHQIGRRNMKEFRRLMFKRHQIVVTTPGFNFSRTDPTSVSRNDRTMSIQAMREVADSAAVASDRSARKLDSIVTEQLTPRTTLEPIAYRDRMAAAAIASTQFVRVRSQIESEAATRSDQMRQADQYRVEIYKKYAIPAACLIFVLVGAPLGIVVRRGNFGVSAAIALGFFIVYWSFLVAGEKLADRGVLSPGISMWLANIVLGVVGLYLTIMVTREFSPIGYLIERIRNALRRRGEQEDGPAIGSEA